VSRIAPLYDDIHDWLTHAVRELRTDAACFHLRSRVGDRLVCQAVTDGLKATHLSYGLDLTGCPAVSEVLQTGEPLAIDNAATDARVAQVARERFGLRSLLYQPVRIAGAFEAVAIFSLRRPHVWAPKQVEQSKRLTRTVQEQLERARIGTRAPLTPQELMLSAVPGMVSLVDEELMALATTQSVDQGRTLEDQSAAVSIDELLRDSDRGHELRRALRDVLSGDLDRFQAMVETTHGQWWVHLRAIPPHPATLRKTLAVVHVQPLPETTSALLVHEERTRLQALGRIAGTVAHEVNNALQHIQLGIAELEGQARAEELDTIAAATQRAGRITSQLLTFARRAPSHFESLDLSEFVSREFELARRSVGSDHLVSLRLRGRVRVRIDVKKMELVLINLCRNAAEASPRGSEITVECGVERQGDHELAYLAVVDPGQGMPPAIANTIGELQASTKPEGLGAGIGLAVVKQVADDHGGKVSATSGASGGTRVAVYLPLDGPKPRPEATPAPADDGVRVLIVEDEAVVARLVARTVGALGHETECCSSLASARAFFDADPLWPQLVLLDLKLGDGTGLEFFEHARVIRPDLRFVVTSGFAEREAILEFSRAGFPILTKPFSRDDLRNAVTAAVRDLRRDAT
ncbi:MAG: ATP-binding protein, partial [Myxococcota bacterium]